MLHRDPAPIEALCTGRLIEKVLRASEPSSLCLSRDDLVQLPDITSNELHARAPELGPDQYEQLMAAVELGRRVYEAKAACNLPRIRIKGSSDAVDYCKARFERLVTDGTQEEFHILTLDTKNHVIAGHQITVGTLDASLVHPREVFRPAIRDAAAAIILVHNHPSGDPTPSREDHAVTRRLESVGETLGISVLDHIIIARDGAKSIREVRA